ncbi:ABC transporter permease [Streptomyces winkii]|uniref:ABC transporter permease n=1 Tax=Streptomyces winkii TaxID=3051178 RepID=UPI0028D19358|nr:ABC transporter permease subunit [Streptomyces sp. DSM 40971]
MSTPTISEQDEKAPGPPPQQLNGRPEEQQAPGGLAVLARDPKVLALAFAVLVVIVSAAVSGSGVWPSGWVVDIKTPLNDLDDWLVDNRDTHWIFLYFLLHISNFAQGSYDALLSLFDSMGYVGVTVVGTLIAWSAGGADLSRRALRTGATGLAVFAVCGVLRMWESTMETLSLMVVAVILSTMVGFLLGVAAGLSDRFEKMLRPVFDTMQVLPAFAYLLPLLLLFDVGVPSALIATVIYAAPPMARLTSLGLRQADPAAMEASASLGASANQQFRTARLPLARRQMMLGLNQTIMMCLSMVVLASLIGSDGLGADVYKALGSLDVGTALTAGSAVVLIAVLLDRTTAAAGERLDATVTVGATRLMRRVRMAVWGLIVVLIGVFSAIGSSLGEREWPDAWTVDVTRPLQDAVDWLTATIGHGVPLLGGTEVWAKGFTVYVLNPLRSGLETTPWWALVLLVAVVGWIVGTWRAAMTAVICLGLVGVMDLWELSMDTFSQVIAGLVVTVAIGVVLGILTARIERVERMLRPVLDTMQTMPQFVYLIPVIALVGLSRSAGIIAAVIYACPAVIRITAQGLRYVDPAAMEASRSLGATSRQQLLGVQLPLARKSLLVGINQGVVLVLSMVVIAGLIGGGALGYNVVQGLSKGNLSQGLPAGIAIVCLGIMLDRISQPAGERPRE